MSKQTIDATAHAITYKPDERERRLRALPLPERSAVFERLSDRVQQAVLTELPIDEIVDLLDHMDVRQAERLVTRVRNPKRRERIVSKLKGDAREKLEYFLRFHPDATTSLIHFNYVLLPADTTIAGAADAMDEYFQDTGSFPEVLVHRDGELIGQVRLATLVRERNTAKLARFVESVQTVTYRAEVAEVVEILNQSQRRKVVVLDHDASVLGIIYGDEALALFGSLPAESLYDVAGVDAAEKPFDGVYAKITNRYRWLILNLVTAFLAGSVVLMFQDTIDALTLLSVYIPVIAGMGSNAASQGFAVMVRGLTIGTISFKDSWPAIRAEIIAGVGNGIIVGAIVAGISIIWNRDPLIGLVVGISTVWVHMVAGFVGSFIPLFMKHIGKDPAATSAIFITTATDIFGLMFMLGLATLVLL